MKKFIYGIAAVFMGENIIGYIEKNSWDWGGTKPESVDVDAEQVPDAPVLTIPTKMGQIAPTFNLIQLDYENIKNALGGTLVKNGNEVVGWKAPTELVELRDSFKIAFVSGQMMSIPNGTLMANLGGKLTLTEVSKIECQLKVNKPEDGGSAYGIADTDGATLAELEAAVARLAAPSAGSSAQAPAAQPEGGDGNGDGE